MALIFTHEVNKFGIIFAKGGECTDLVRDFSCQCGAGYSGRMCEMKLHDCNVNNTCTACDSTPCVHGSCNCTCNATIMYYNCTCDDGYTGVNCDQDINECVNGSICGDNGTCINTNGTFRCQVSYFYNSCTVFRLLSCTLFLCLFASFHCLST